MRKIKFTEAFVELPVWLIATLLAVLGLAIVSAAIVRVVRHAVAGTASEHRADVLRALRGLVREITHLIVFWRR